MPLPPAKRNRQEDADASPNDEASAAKKAAKSDVENTTPSHDVDDLETAGTNPTPIFLKKTYKMIDSCDPDIAGWSPDGLSFIVKDTEIFASDIIPQYFDHNKFSSFARQLNFYGFRKIQTKPIKNADYDETTAKYVTFFNDKFRRGRQDLLREITRSTRSSGGTGGASSSGGKGADSFRATITSLEQRVAELERKLKENLTEMKGRVDLIVMELAASRQSQQQHALFGAQMAAMGAVPAGLLPSAMPPSAVASALTAAGAHTLPSSTLGDAAACTLQNVSQKSFGSGDTNWEQQPMLGSDLVRAFSSTSARYGQPAQVSNLARVASSGRAADVGKAASGGSNKEADPPAPSAEAATTDSSAPATLPPHPKQKNVPPQTPADAQAAATAQGPAAGAIRNSLMIRNAWENDFFNNLMMAGAADGAAAAASRAASMASLGKPDLRTPSLSALQQMSYPSYFQNRAAMQSMFSPGMAMLPQDPSLAGAAQQLNTSGDAAANQKRNVDV